MRRVRGPAPGKGEARDGRAGVLSVGCRVPSPGKAGSGQSWKLSVVFPFSVAQVKVLQSELWEGTLK